jgi:hypothetical protein
MPCGKNSPTFKTKQYMMAACLNTPLMYPSDIEIYFFFARFNDALANPYGPSNPDSAIKTQFIDG